MAQPVGDIKEQRYAMVVMNNGDMYHIFTNEVEPLTVKMEKGELVYRTTDAKNGMELKIQVPNISVVAEGGRNAKR